MQNFFEAWHRWHKGFWYFLGMVWGLDFIQEASSNQNQSLRPQKPLRLVFPFKALTSVSSSLDSSLIRRSIACNFAWNAPPITLETISYWIFKAVHNRLFLFLSFPNSSLWLIYCNRDETEAMAFVLYISLRRSVYIDSVESRT